VYKKEGSALAHSKAPHVDALIYFWDTRDGPTFAGWWFGPKVGGDDVWAYNPDISAQQPPFSGWKVPWDGPVDEALCLAVVNRPPTPPPNQPLPQQTQEEFYAASLVRKAIQQLRNSSPESFQLAKETLERTHLANISKLGRQTDIIMQEAARAIVETQAFITDLEARRVADQDRRKEEAKQLKIERVNLDKLLEEANHQVDEAENGMLETAQIASFCVGLAQDASPEMLRQAADRTEAAVVESTNRLNSVSRCLSLKRKEVSGSSQAVAFLKDDFKPLFGRLAVCRRMLEKYLDAARIARERAWKIGPEESS